MQIKDLYRYEREPGKVTVSPIKPDCEYDILYIIIASENHLVTQNGVDLFPCVDTDSTEGWYEVEAPEEPKMEEQ